MGDLSENGAYIYAKFELGSITRQLSQLRHLLKNGVVIQKSLDNERVVFGCTVTLTNGKKELTFTLVSMHESDLANQKLSIESPIGMAIIGKKVGDTAQVETPNGKIEYKILKIA
jgi:transcription elongation factor GreA